MNVPLASECLDPSELTARERYHLMTSLVVPRPIGWLSTWGPERVPNLAPFSYFTALSISPMLVGVSIGNRRDGPKDTLVNVRSTGAFCANVVTESLLVAMNETSASIPPEEDEFALAGLTLGTSERVDAPFVAECPAVLECTVQQEVDLRGAPNTLVIAEVIGLRLDPALEVEEGTRIIRPESLHPVGRLGGPAYAVADDIQRILRPDLR